MSTKNTSNREENEQTTEQHDCHIQTGNMSGENTSYRKIKVRVRVKYKKWTGCRNESSP